MEIYTDGSCFPNPGFGGWAFVILDAENLPKLVSSGRAAETTNNQMELLAIFKAIEYTVSCGDPGEVTIFTDSRYCIGALSGEWKLRANKEIIKKTWKLMEEAKLKNISVEFEWVKGHAGNIGNEFADFYANDGGNSLGIYSAG